MPSSKPLIALRLEQPLYDRVAAMAHQQGRTPANFIAQQLRVSLSMTPAMTKQLDLADQIAQAVKRGPSKGAKHK
jgi:predicted DNA-binding protein